MTNANNSIRHGDMMLALGRSFGASDARSAVMRALFTATYRVLTKDEVDAVLDEVDAISKRGMDEHTAIWRERANTLS